MDICDFGQLLESLSKIGGKRREKFMKVLAVVCPDFDPKLAFYRFPKTIYLRPEERFAAEKKWREMLAFEAAIVRRRAAGETLKGLSRRYGVSLADIKYVLATENRRKVKAAGRLRRECDARRRALAIPITQVSENTSII